MAHHHVGLLAGLPTAKLQAALAEAQQAYLDLSTGAKGVSYAYTQGDGSKAVTYTQTNLPQLDTLIRGLQFQLRETTRTRFFVGFRY